MASPVTDNVRVIASCLKLRWTHLNEFFLFNSLNLFLFSGMITILPNPRPSLANTKRAWQTSNVSCYSVVSAWIEYTSPSQTSWPEGWARSMLPRRWSALRRYSSSPIPSPLLSSSSVLVRILPVILWSWLRGQDLAVTNSNFLPWDRDRRR